MRTALIGFLLCILVLPVGATSARPATHGTQVRKLTYGTRHRLRHRRIRFRGLPVSPELRGSHESLLKQNEEIDRLGLPRIQDKDELEQLKAAGDLVPLQESKFLRVDPRLPEARRYCRPWTMSFLDDLSREYFAEFKKPLQVNSAVRTVKDQQKLRRHNRNAAPVLGDTASSHLAGVTVDIAKHGMTKKEHQWMADYLANLKNEEVIEPEEERRQPVYHVMVTDRYLTYRGGREAGPGEARAPWFKVESNPTLDAVLTAPSAKVQLAPAVATEVPPQENQPEVPKD